MLFLDHCTGGADNWTFIQRQSGAGIADIIELGVQVSLGFYGIVSGFFATRHVKLNLAQNDLGRGNTLSIEPREYILAEDNIPLLLNGIRSSFNVIDVSGWEAALNIGQGIKLVIAVCLMVQYPSGANHN